MRLTGVWLAALSLTGCGRTGPGGLSANDIPAESQQAIIVRPELNGPDGGIGMTLWQREKGAWTLFDPGLIPCVVGRNGIAPRGEKREGDGRTPAGVYRIGLAFGYEPSVETGLEYRQATAADFWVDDPESPQYNRWVTGKPDAKSFEKLRRDDDAYKYAAVINYNTDPVLPGHGSAIFLHVWRAENVRTDGCIAIHEQNMKYLLGWLDRRQNPVIIVIRRNAGDGT